MKKYLTDGNQTVKVDVYYNLGGHQWSTGQTQARGVYVLVVPVEVQDHGGYKTETVRAFSGIKKCVKELGRKSQKQIEIVFNKVDEYLPELFAHIGLDYNNFQEEK